VQINPQLQNKSAIALLESAILGMRSAKV